jgi:HlyD family secretion protein
MKRLISMYFAGILSLLFLMTGCKTRGPQPTGSGTIETTEVIISSAISGEILERPVEEGGMVRNGDLLIRLDTQNIALERAAAAAGLGELEASETLSTAQIAQAKTALDGARKNYDRAVDLKARGSISIQQYDDVSTAYQLAQRQLDTAKTSLETIAAKKLSLDARLKVLDKQIADGTIVAPMEGIVLETFVERGERVMPGKPLLKLAKFDEVWVKIYMSEKDLGKVKLGGKAKVISDSDPDHPVDGRISWISAQAEFTPKNVQTRDARADLVYAVKITIKNPKGDFKIGMPVDVTLEGFPEYEAVSRPTE